MTELVIYQSDDGQVRTQFRPLADSLWPTQLDMASLFGVSLPCTNIHIKKILAEGELPAESVIKQDLVAVAAVPPTLFHSRR